jgi:hypothetical protein
VRALAAAPSASWTALSGLQSPTQFFVADSAGRVASWTEPWRLDHLAFSLPPAAISPVPPALGVTYLDAQAAPEVGLFGTFDGGLWVAGVFADGGVEGVDSQPCDLAEPQGAAVSLQSTSLVAGLARSCPGLAGGAGRFVATLWPRGLPNPPPRALSALPAPDGARLRVSSNGDVAVLAYETQAGLSVARVDGNGVQENVGSVALAADGGLTRPLLEAALQLADRDAFLYALTNRGQGVLTVTPDAVGATPLAVPAGATLVVFARWTGGASVVEATQLLTPGRPFSGVRLASDPGQSEAWLAASCPAAPDGGTFDTFCPGPGAHHALLRWVP